MVLSSSQHATLGQTCRDLLALLLKKGNCRLIGVFANEQQHCRDYLVIACVLLIVFLTSSEEGAKKDAKLTSHIRERILWDF
jgi:hypothetical protein